MPLKLDAQRTVQSGTQDMVLETDSPVGTNGGAAGAEASAASAGNASGSGGDNPEDEKKQNGLHNGLQVNSSLAFFKDRILHSRRMTTSLRLQLELIAMWPS